MRYKIVHEWVDTEGARMRATGFHGQVNDFIAVELWNDATDSWEDNTVFSCHDVKQMLVAFTKIEKEEGVDKPT